jgi:excinuclease ABC subunit B
MERAIGETERRRNTQIAHNEKMGITPQALNKTINDIIDGTQKAPGRTGAMAKRRQKVEKIGAEAVSYMHMSVAELSKEMVKIEDKMHKAAKDMKFEQAAGLRDQLMELKDLLRAR